MFEKDELAASVPPDEASDRGVSRRDALKRGGLLLAGGSLVGAIAACGGGDKTATAAAGSSASTGSGASDSDCGLLGRGIVGGEILFITFSSTLNYFDGHKQGFKDAVKAFGGGKFATVGPATGDPAAQLVEVQRAVAQKTPMAICPFEDKLFAPEIDKALDKGIPVITVDGGSPSSRAAHVGTGNLSAGRIAGERMIEEIGGSGSVLVTRQQTDNPTFKDREQGFKEAIAATGGKVKIVGTINDFDDAEKAATAVGQALQVHSDLDGVFTISAGAGLGTVKAVQQANRANLKVGAFSNDTAVYEALKENGPLTFVAAQETYKMGFYSGVMLQLAAAKALTPDYDLEKAGVDFPLPPDTDTGVAILDGDNVDAFV